LNASITDEVVIESRALTKAFRGGVLAVDAVDFAVHRRSVCGLLGPNGAGKTTTLRMLVGLIRPTSGTAQVLGVEIEPGSAVLGRVGTMIEHAEFVPYLPGLLNLRLYWESTGADLASANLDRALGVAGLGDAVHRKVKTYSQGMRQRLGIARALLGAPDVLVLDEPTNGLDPGEMREIRALLQRLSDDGVTVLLSSHLLGEVEQVCDQVVVMDRGRVVRTGTVSELTQASASAYVEVDDVPRAAGFLAALPGVRSVGTEGPGLAVELDGMTRAGLVRALVEQGFDVDTVTSRHRLEDAFLGLIDSESA
jgi:ABC-2 type transport system ATP-binding protein